MSFDARRSRSPGIQRRLYQRTRLSPCGRARVCPSGSTFCSASSTAASPKSARRPPGFSSPVVTSLSLPPTAGGVLRGPLAGGFRVEGFRVYCRHSLENCIPYGKFDRDPPQSGFLHCEVLPCREPS